MIDKPSNWKDVFREGLKSPIVRGAQVLGLCPFHEDTRQSFSLNLETSQWKCFAGCGEGNYWGFKKKVDEGFKRHATPLQNASSSVPRPSGEELRLAQTYTYEDVAGKALYQVLRYEPKAFKQRKVLGEGRFEWNMRNVERVPYRLSQLKAAPEKVLWWVEGEKDTDFLVRQGLLASTSSGGANQWDASLIRFIDQKFVVALPDQDMAGQAYVSQVIEDLTRAQKTVLQWDVHEGKDIADFWQKNSGLSLAELKDLIWNNGTFWFSKEDPFLYFEKQKIQIDSWSHMKTGRTQFLMKQCQSVYDYLTNLLEPHHLKVVDFIDGQAKKTRDESEYKIFCNGLMYLLEVKKFHEQFYR